MSAKMNPKVKKKWIAALKSGKYKQCSKKLKSGNGYCCLGVLTRLYCQKTKKGFKNVINGDNQLLCEKVMDWAGLKSCNPDVYSVEGCCDLAEMNDNGKTFNEIANVIKVEL